MGKKQDPSKKEQQRKILMQQKFSIAGAIGRAGSGLMKGESPIPPQEQSIAQLNQWIDLHTPDPSGALKSILRRRVRDNELVMLRHLQHPFNALKEIIETILTSEYALKEFVRQVDVRWGELYQERPLFEAEGQAPNPADEYTHESVHQDLILLLEKLPQSRPNHQGK
jgi:hypothetical protein